MSGGLVDANDIVCSTKHGTAALVLAAASMTLPL